jgi:hypothetical protein
MINKPFIATATAIVCMSTFAFAAVNKELKEAKIEVTKACKKEFPTEVSGKKFAELHDWIEKSVHGEKSEDFKKTKCYEAHENWEKVAAKKETS